MKENDIVLLEYASYFNFPPEYGDNEKFIKAKIIHIPSDTGDFWVFESLDYKFKFFQNPMDSNFVRIYPSEVYDATKEGQITKDYFEKHF